MGNSMDEIKRMICQELDDIAEKGEMSSGDLDAIHKLVVTKEKLLRIEEIEDELGYSGDGDWRAEGSYRDNSNRDSYRGGSYRNSSYDGNSSRGRRRDSMGRYSRSGGSTREKMMDMIQNDDLTYSQRQALQSMMDEM